MRTASIILLCIALSVSWAGAQSENRAGISEEYLFVGEVTGNNVNVRSAPNLNAYRCTKVHRNTRVNVLDRQQGWLKIYPTEGCYCMVSKQWVDVDADGSTGTITGNNVLVRAGGELRTANFHEHLKGLNQGDKVRITGQIGDFYRIDPPRGVGFWISADYVRPVGGVGLIADAQTSSDQADTAEDDEDATTSQVAVTQEVTTQPAAVSSAAQQAWEQAEAALMQEYAKEINQQNLEGMLSMYNAIPSDEAIDPYVQYRIRFLQQVIERRKEQRSLDRIVRNAQEYQQQMKSQRLKLEMDPAATPSPDTTYVATGILSPSEMFPGGGGKPRRFLLRRPDTTGIVAYVQSADNTVNLAEFVGKLVGVHGTKSFDTGIRFHLVEAQEVVILDDADDSSAGAGPRVKFTPPASDVVVREPAPQPSPPVVPPVAEEEATEGDTPAVDDEPGDVQDVESQDDQARPEEPAVVEAMVIVPIVPVNDEQDDQDGIEAPRGAKIAEMPVIVRNSPTTAPAQDDQGQRVDEDSAVDVAPIKGSSIGAVDAREYE